MDDPPPAPQGRREKNADCPRVHSAARAAALQRHRHRHLRAHARTDARSGAGRARAIAPRLHLSWHRPRADRGATRSGAAANLQRVVAHHARRHAAGLARAARSGTGLRPRPDARGVRGGPCLGAAAQFHRRCAGGRGGTAAKTHRALSGLGRRAHACAAVSSTGRRGTRRPPRGHHADATRRDLGRTWHAEAGEIHGGTLGFIRRRRAHRRGRSV